MQLSRSIRILALAGILLLPAVAALGERVRVPVPFRIDQGEVLSSMAIEVEKSALPPLTPAQAAAQPLPPDLEALFRLVRTLREGTPEAVLELSRLSPNENPADRLQLIQGYQTAFADKWDDLRLLSRYDLNGYSTYTWQVTGPQGPYVRSFSLSGIEDGFRWVDDTGHDLDHLIDTLLMQAEQLQVDGVEAPPLPENYRYSENLRGSGASLLFNGAVLRWDVFGESIPQLPVAALLHGAYAAFSRRDLDAFASFWTPYSGAKFLDWVGNMPATEFEAYFADVTGGMELRFIIDADPVFVVYYNTPDGVRNTTLVREGEALKLTNFYIGGLIDALLEDRNLFVIPVVARLVSGDVDPIPTIAPGAGAAQAAQPAVAAAAPVPAVDASTDAAEPAPPPAADAGAPASGKLRKAWLLLLIPLIVVVLLKRKSRNS